MPAAAQRRPDVVAECPDVEPLGALDGEAGVGNPEVVNPEPPDVDEPRLALNLLALARHFVERNASDLDGGHHGRSLEYVAGKIGCDKRLQRFARDAGRIAGRNDLAFGILSVRRGAEPENPLVDLVAAHDGLAEVGAAPDKKRQQPGRLRIESPAMPDFLETEHLADDAHDVV